MTSKKTSSRKARKVEPGIVRRAARAYRKHTRIAAARLPPKNAKWIPLARLQKMAEQGKLRDGWFSIWGDVLVWAPVGSAEAAYACGLDEVCAQFARLAGAIDGGTNPL